MDNMSLSYFDLNGRPFPSIPVADQCCYFPTFQENLNAVEAALRQQAGPALILGGAGTGKTMLLRALAQRLHMADGMCVSLDAAFSNRQEFFQALLFELGLEQLASSTADLRLALTTAVRSRPEFVAGIWLLIDEAHSLNDDLFEQLRLLSNLVRDGRSLFQMAFAGSRQLEERLLNPSLESLQQRIACRAYLTGMSLEELRGYIEFHWRRVGGHVSPLTMAAIQAVHTATMGIPRLVNQLCDQAVSYAAIQKLRVIDEQVIQVAWALWQRLPIPQIPERTSTSSSSKVSASTSMVEFGSLDDEPMSDFSVASEPIRTAELTEQRTPARSESMDSPPHAGPPDSATLAKPVAMEFNSAREMPGPAASSDRPLSTTKLASETLIRFAFETDIQKPPPQIDFAAEREVPEVPAKPPVAATREMNVARELDGKLDTIQQALASLQEPWDPIEEMLIEADLQAMVSPLEIVDQSAQTTRQMVSNEPSIVFQDHLYLESLWMEDTVWTQYIRTPETEDEVSPVSLPLPGIENVQPAVNHISNSSEATDPLAGVSAEIRIDENPHRKVNPPQSLSRWESVRAIDSPAVDWSEAEPALSSELRSSEGSFRDDASIIHRQPVATAAETPREHAAQPLPPPVLARRKDLRALLHALRGY